jgi:AcrR family transcriptional regulator
MTSEPSLRERQARDVRARIRAAFVALVVERGPEGFPLTEVASRAGIAERTLYRHYPNRDAIVDGIEANEVAAMDAELPKFQGWQSLLESRTPFVADSFQVFDRNADLVNATRSLRASGVRNEASYARTEQLRQIVSSIDGVPDDAVDQLVGLIRLLSASDGWARLTEPDLGLDAARAGEAAEWAIRVLIEAARSEPGFLGKPNGA